MRRSFWIILLGLLCITALNSCKTVYVPVESVHTDTLIVNKWQRDSVYIETLKHDSILIRESGDTVYVSRWHTEYVDRWREKEVHDTTYISRVDSIQVPYPVEKKLTAWQKFKMSVGSVPTMLLFLFVVFIVIWLVRTRRN